MKMSNEKNKNHCSWYLYFYRIIMHSMFWAVLPLIFPKRDYYKLHVEFVHWKSVHIQISHSQPMQVLHKNANMFL